MKNRQYRSSQGRSPDRMKKKYQIMGYTLVLGLITIVCIIVEQLLN